MRRVLVCLVLFVTSAWAQTPLELEVLRLTNLERARVGLPPLVWDARAYAAAQRHAKDMLERGFFSHVNPEGLDAADRMRQAGVLEVTVGENLAFFEHVPDEAVPGEAVRGWMESPGHRANLLSAEFTHVGIAMARLGDRVMVVQNFLARPFPLEVRRDPGVRVRVGELVIEGPAATRVGVFVEGLFVTAFDPPRVQGVLEVLPGSEVVLAVEEGGAYYAACSFTLPETRCDARELRVRLAYREEVREGVRLQLTLPQGAYLIARGEEPTPLVRANGPLTLEAPFSWRAVWVGALEGRSVQYTHRVPLQPSEAMWTAGP
ncbi:CAP domain-containing protein [Marinithermus hydrothermalis]|uniref:SCP-like extracellular n=1 Tax=Marinithermus hydrothermalis (strain DSM 14884 / JCM 11576 / T1) TaxID=869210 RepID=F2NP34_MARHT|nr:CAP domain-containing protein [Marinithermus hydrothermalis]AEB11622.1 SCP-like extracellular [Marinithermus hydrothermalis DSM 14884]